MTDKRDIVINISRKSFLRLAVVVLLAAVSIPTAVWAADRFTDVPTTNVFHNDITALADAGVTRGCNPPTNDQFCPNDVVTRGQMAAFLNRLGALSGQTPVVDAATLNGMDSDAFVAAGEPLFVIPREETVNLTGGARSECVPKTSLLFTEAFQVFHQISSTPAGIEPWEINVGLDASLGGGNYELCLAAIDEGTVLPAGQYELFGWMVLQ